MAIVLLFTFVAAIGTTSVWLSHYNSGITGAATSYVHYTDCTDYGNYIILSNDAGWKKIAKDKCTGTDDQFLARVACVQNEWGWYEVGYAEIVYCASGASCTLDDNDAAYCPGDGVEAVVTRADE